MKKHMKNVVQLTSYFITEWDDSTSLVKVRSVGARVVQRCADGSPHLCAGGDVLMQYEDGVVHKVTSKYFESLNPRVSIAVSPRDMY